DTIGPQERDPDRHRSHANAARRDPREAAPCRDGCARRVEPARAALPRHRASRGRSERRDPKDRLGHCEEARTIALATELASESDARGPAPGSPGPPRANAVTTFASRFGSQSFWAAPPVSVEWRA